MNQRNPKPILTPDQTDALRGFAKRNGRRWKSKLLGLWMDGQDWREPEAPFLRQIRNTIGPADLMRLKLPEPPPDAPLTGPSTNISSSHHTNNSAETKQVKDTTPMPYNQRQPTMPSNANSHDSATPPLIKRFEIVFIVCIIGTLVLIALHQIDISTFYFIVGALSLTIALIYGIMDANNRPGYVPLYETEAATHEYKYSDRPMPFFALPFLIVGSIIIGVGIWKLDAGSPFVFLDNPILRNTAICDSPPHYIPRQWKLCAANMMCLSDYPITIQIHDNYFDINAENKKNALSSSLDDAKQTGERWASELDQFTPCNKN